MRATSTLISLLLLAACSEADSGSPKGENHEPVATIISHKDGDTEREGAAFTLRGTVSDVDESADTLRATWYTGARELCASAAVSADGGTTCEATLALGEEEVVLVAQDSEGASGTARVEILLEEGGSPSVSITSPEADGVYFSSAAITVSAVVSDEEDAPTALVVAWTDENGDAVDLDAVPDADGALADTLVLASGAHTLTLTVTDSSGKSSADAVDFTVGDVNRDPLCSIVAPADGSYAPEGTSVTFEGELSDPDVAADLLTAAWSSDLDGGMGGGAVRADGSAAVTLTTLSVGTHVITLTGTDDQGATCADTVIYSVGEPPEATIDAPVEGDIYNVGEEITFLGSVVDSQTAPDALGVTWESDVDGELDTTSADAAGLTTFDLATLSAGDHVISLTALDGDGLYDIDTIGITINTLPTAPVVSITPGAPGSDDDLTAVMDTASVDADGDVVTYAYDWAVDGAASSYSSATVPASATTRDEVWTVTVTPNDGVGDGPSASASVTIENALPTVADATLSPDPAYEGDTLTCTAGKLTDADGDAVSVSYAWTVNGSTLATTAATLDDSNWSRDDVVTCTITPDDGTTAGAAAVSAALTISNSLPSLSDVVMTPVLPDVSDTLECTASGYLDADGDADETTIEWTVNGVVVGSGDTLSGLFEGGDEVVCTATPFDGTDAGAALTDSVVIENTLPVLADVAITPSSPTEADTLTCVPGSTTDADGTTSFTYTYAWSVNGTAISASTATLAATYFAHNDVVRCSATPNDGLDAGATVTSSGVTILNTAPVASALTLTPSPAGTSDTLTATVTATDIDGDTVSLTYVWTVDGSAVAESGATLSGVTYFDFGDVVAVTVTPTDGTVSGSSVSASTTISNSLPSVSSVTISPAPAYASDTLSCAYSGFSDTDGDADESTLAWTVNGAAAGSASTLSTGFVSGDTVACTVTPYDGTDTGTPVADSLTVTNTPPVLADVTLTPTVAYELSTLTCTPGATTDADGTTSFAHRYVWTVNGSAVTPTSTTLSGTYFSAGDSVICTITPNDGTSDGAAVASNTVTIANSLPEITSVTLSSSVPYTNDTLTATAATADGDGGTVTIAYAWFVNGSVIAPTTSTLSGTSYFSRGDTVYVQVTPNDGTSDGVAVSSSVATVENSAPSITSVGITPASPSAADTLTCTVTGYTDADLDPSESTYEWTVNAVAVGSDATLAGAFVRGDVVACVVTPYDGTLLGTPRTSSNVTIANSVPVLASVDLTPTTAYEADVLTCTPGAVTDADGTTSFTYTYAWRVGGTLTSITSTTLSGSAFAKNQAVYCLVTPNDGTGAGTAVASNTVTISNTAPVVSTVVLSSYVPGTSATLTTTVRSSDVDGDTRTLSYAWYVNDVLIAPATSSLAGTTYFSRGDTVYVSVTPSDGTTSGTPVSSPVATVANSVPTITSVAISPTAATAADTLTCVPTGYADADGDTSVSTTVWSVNSTVVGTASTLSGAFVRGDIVACSITPNDGTDTGTTRSSSNMTIGNAAPVIASVDLSPTTAYEADTLTCTPGSTTDADGTTSFTYTYTWRVAGSLITQTTATLTGSYFNKNQAVYCTAVPSDGTGFGTGVASNSVTISNTAPVISTVALSSYTPGTSTTLTTTVTSSDVDSDTRTYTYAWYVNDILISPVTSSLAGTSYFTRDDTVYVSVIPSDGTTSGDAVASTVATVGNTAPSITSVTVTPATATLSDTLTCTANGYSDADGDVTASTYAWTVNGTAAGTATTLAGAFVRGDAVVCTVTPSDGTDTGTARSSTSLTIGNSSPVLASVDLTPTTAYEGSTMACTPGTTTDADGTTSFTYTYTWRVAGSLISQTSSTLTGTYFAKNQAVICNAIPNDGTGAGASVASNSVTISNTAPVMTSVTLSSYAPTTSATLTATAAATDADSDSRTYAYAWYVNGSVVAATTSTLSGATYFSRGDTVYVSVTPSDSASSGTAMASAAATVANSPPSITSVAISPTTAYAADTLTCVVTGYTDVDGDATASTTAWTIGGTAAGTGSTLAGGFYRGDAVVCAVTPSDGTDTGTVRTSSTRTISNTAPVLASVALTPTTAYEADTMTCTPGSTTDADGTTSFTYTYAWRVGGSAISQTTSTLSGTYFSKTQAVYCTATPNDGTGNGTGVASNSVTISNTAPTISAVTLSTYAPTTGTTITTSITSADVDGDSRTFTYAWYVNGSVVAGTASSLSGTTYFSSGDSVYVRVTPSDGTTSGSAVDSSAATVINSAPAAPVVSIDPEDPEEALDDLVCMIDTASTDADGDTVTYTFTWTVDGGAYSGATDTSTTSTVDAAETATGDVWLCSATPNDGTTSGSAGTDSVTVLAPSYMIGYYTEYSSTGSEAVNYLFAVEVTVTSALDLYSLGHIAKIASGNVKMALYSDTAGAPGTRVAYTASAATVVGALEIDVVGAPVSVAAGDYWLVWACGTSACRTAYTTSGVSSNVVFYKSANFATAFPVTFGAATALTGQAYNIYGVVR